MSLCRRFASKVYGFPLSLGKRLASALRALGKQQRTQIKAMTGSPAPLCWWLWRRKSGQSGQVLRPQAVTPADDIAGGSVDDDMPWSEPRQPGRRESLNET